MFSVVHESNRLESDPLGNDYINTVNEISTPGERAYVEISERQTSMSSFEVSNRRVQEATRDSRVEGTMTRVVLVGKAVEVNGRFSSEKA